MRQAIAKKGQALQLSLANRVTFLERVMGIITIVYPLSAIPQIVQIYRYKDVSGASLLTWGLFLLFMIPFFLYWIARNEKKLIVMYGLWIMMYVVIITGVVIYS